jgi:prepilin-type N-terminal cleavage/methylation domain-containing protein
MEVNMKLFKKFKKGFTIVELVVVIAVIAILAATSIGVYFGMVDSANRSADQTAVVQMNKVLVLENTLGNVDSILDVHEVFERNGLTAKNYTALKTGYKFYYDEEENKILYVNPNGVVEFPEEEVGKDHSTHNWYSLNLSIDKEKAPKNNEGSYVISKPQQLAYVFDELNTSAASIQTKIVLENDIDMRGASVVVDTLKAGSSFTLESSNGTVKTIKNLVSNKSHLKSLSGFGVTTSYYTATLFGTVAGDVTINNIKFENAHVKDEEGSTVSILFGLVSKGNVALNNVEFLDCSVTGGRNVGLVAGNNQQSLNSSLKLTGIKATNSTVNVKHGRSGLLIGMMEYGHSSFVFNMSNVTLTNSSMKKVGSYEFTTEMPAGFDEPYAYPTDLVDEQVYISFLKENTKSTYAFLESAIVTYRYGTTSKSPLAAITDVSSPITSLVRG